MFLVSVVNISSFISINLESLSFDQLGQEYVNLVHCFQLLDSLILYFYLINFYFGFYFLLSTGFWLEFCFSKFLSCIIKSFMCAPSGFVLNVGIQSSKGYLKNFLKNVSQRWYYCVFIQFHKLLKIYFDLFLASSLSISCLISMNFALK